MTNYANVRWATEDIRRARGDHIASVVHLAAYYDFSGGESPLYEKVTVEGTDRLLNHLQSFELEQFVFSSTMLVHRPTKPGETITEDSPLEGKWAYPMSKIRTEKLITTGHPQVNGVLLRIAGVYDELGRQPTLAQQIKRIRDKDLQGHLFPADTAAGQSAVHLDDAVDAIVRTVERRNQIPAKTPILIGEPDPPSYADLQAQLGELLHGKEWATYHIPAWFAKAGAAVQEKTIGSFIKPFMVDMAGDHYDLDVSRARDLLDWQPKHRLRDFPPHMIKIMLRDPDLWDRENEL